VPAPGNIPGSRNSSVGWIDSSGDLWLFGGVGYAVNGANGVLNDLWKFSNGQWTWVSGSPLTCQIGVCGVRGVAAPANTPGWRQTAASWTDASGNFWLVGGYGMAGGTEGDLADLWMYTPSRTHTHDAAGHRILIGVATDSRFGAGPAEPTLSEGVSVGLYTRLGLLPRVNSYYSSKPFIINKIRRCLPNRGVRHHIDVARQFRPLIIVSKGFRAARNRGEICAKPSAHSGVRNNRELAQLGF
jgi:hypothetical protein